MLYSISLAKRLQQHYNITIVITSSSPPDPANILKKTNHRKMIARFFDIVTDISMILDRRMSLELDKQNNEEVFWHFRKYVSGVCNDGSIENKTTVSEIFQTICATRYWDLHGQPYDLLLLIIEGLKDEDLMEMVQKGEQEYCTQYLVATKVVDYINQHKSKKLTHSVEYTPNMETLSIKLDIDVNIFSMAYLFDLWKAIKHCSRLPRLFCVLSSIEEGCLTVTWLVPTFAVPTLKTLPCSSPQLFTEFPITEMTISGTCTYKV